MQRTVFIQNLVRLSHIPVSVYHESGELAERTEPLAHPLTKYEQELTETVLSRLRSVRFTYETYKAGLPVCIMGCRGADCCFILGPFAYAPAADLEHKLRKLRLAPFAECPWNDALAAAVFLINAYADPDYTLTQLEETISEKKHDVQQLLVNEEIRQWENFQKNHTYDDENVMYRYVESGNVDYLAKNSELLELPHPVILSDFYKNEEYMAAITISFAARAAIRGGVTSRESLLVNDIYLKQLEACENVSEIKHLTRSAMLHFARLVKKKQGEQSQNIHVEKCKKALYAHRLENISLQELAGQVGISKEYLLKLFKKQEGIPITEYIRNVKIEAACNMLAYSGRQISEIAEYLGFGSLSYFSRSFKAVTGLSPVQYRKVHAHPDY